MAVKEKEKRRTEALYRSFIESDMDRSEEIIRECLGDGVLHCTVSVITPALERLGADWEEGRASLSQIYLAGKLCRTLMEESQRTGSVRGPDQPVIAIAVLEDHHSLGKTTVHNALAAAGYAVQDYGAGVTADALVRRVKEDGTAILLVSTLMLRAALRVRDLSSLLRQEGLSTVLVVGGAPFNFDPDLWREVGADAMAHNAYQAIDVVERFLRDEGVSR